MMLLRPFLARIGGNMAWYAGVFLLATGGLRALEDGDVKGLTHGSAPLWVEPRSWALPEKPAPAGTPAEILLSDAQDRLTATGSDYYYRTVVRLLNSEGVRQNAEPSVVYSPEYQQVTWHTLRLIRGDQIIDLLPAAKFRQLQRELGFEAKIYDGQITAATVLEGVHIGDILEQAYTLRDVNPLLLGQFSSRHYLGAGYPVRQLSFLVRAPAEVRSLARYIWIPPGTHGLPDALFRPSDVLAATSEEDVGTERLYRWQARNVPAVIFDADISPQAAPYYSMVRWSSFHTWWDIARWATALFEGSGPLPESLQNQVAAWRKQLPTDAQRLRAAVDWAQGEVRYFAMAMGSHNLKPRALTDICSTGFGDCKDKSVLLVALLRGLGFKAWPVLVQSYAQNKLREDGPDLFAFNHAIVAYEYEGSLHWVDPTLKQPAGRAGEWAVPPYRLGLILREGELKLTPIAGPAMAGPDTVTRDRVTIDPGTGDAVLVTTVTMRGLEADFYRQHLEGMAAVETSKRWFNYISQFYRRLQEERAPEITDDRAGNVITIQAQYRLPEFRRTEGGRTSFAIYAYALRALLNQPESRRRHWPYGLPTTRHIRQEIEVLLPDQPPVDERPQVIVTPGAVYASAKGLSRNRLFVTHDLEYPGDYVPAASMADFADAAAEILNDLSTNISSESPPKT